MKWSSLINVYFFSKMWVEVVRQVFNWPRYVNTGAFVISLISIVLLFVLKVINEKLLPKVKCSCKLWWSTARTFKWPIPIPSQIVMVSPCLLLKLNWCCCVYMNSHIPSSW